MWRSLMVVVPLAGCAQLLGITDPGASGGDGGSHPTDGNRLIDAPPGGDAGTPRDGSVTPDAFGPCTTATLTYGGPQMLPVTGAETFALADLDHDGDLDLVVATQTDTVFLLNNGAGTFGPATKLIVGENEPADGVVAADFNGDGRIDVLRWSNDADTLSMSLHATTTSASFVDGPVTTLAGAPNVVAAFGGLFDSDALADVAVVTSQGKTFIFRGSATGSLSAGATIGGTAAGVFDVDGDGKRDLLFTPELGVTFGVGDGTFGAMFNLGTTGSGIAGGFASGTDAKLALVTLEGNDVTVHRQPTARTFAAGEIAFSPLALAPGGLQVLDVDGDGRSDVVGLDQVVQSCKAPAPLGQLATTATAIPANQAAFQQLVDVSGDGRPDLITIDTGEGNVIVRLHL